MLKLKDNMHIVLAGPPTDPITHTPAVAAAAAAATFFRYSLHYAYAMQTQMRLAHLWHPERIFVPT